MMAELGILCTDLMMLLYVFFIIADVDNFVENRFDLVATNKLFLIISKFIFIHSMSHKD